MSNEINKVAFVWENFGPIHADRCDATATHFGAGVEVIGIELFGISQTYAWLPESGKYFRKKTLFPNKREQQVGIFSRAFQIVRCCVSLHVTHVFLCHYEHPATLLAAIVLRLLGRQAIIMNDSKFDDYPRYLWREVLKSFFYLPYSGGMASGWRSRDYLRFLGVNKENVAGVYNSMSIDRIRELSGAPPAPEGLPFEQRHFTIVARFVPKKNLRTAIAAYAIYVSRTASPRKLQMYGSGPLEDELMEQVKEAGLERHVQFNGFCQTAEICKALASTLLLVLPSIEEQFGNVVIEAQAMGVPVILSSNCGACDTLIRTGVNGFIVEPMNEEGYAFFMGLLASDINLWKQFSSAAARFVPNGSAERFAEAVAKLVREL